MYQNKWLYYTALGDSLSAGIGTFLRDGFVKAYHQKLEHYLHLPVYMQVYAKPGITSSQLLSYLNAPNIRQSISRSKIITLNIGGNDLIQANKQYKQTNDPRVFEQAHFKLYDNLNKILSFIHFIKQHQSIYLIQVLGLYNPYPNLPYSDYWIVKTNNSIRDITRNYSHTMFIDIYPVFQIQGKELITFWGIHPNGKGHQTIADEFMRSSFNYFKHY